MNLDAARNNLIERLNKPECAAVFGGLPKALKALKETKFKFKALGGPQAVGRLQIYSGPDATTQDKTVTINTQGRFYMENLSLPIAEQPGARTDPAVLDLSEISYGRSDEHVNIADDVTFATFILAHELGHRTGSYGKDDKDGRDDKNGTQEDKTARNNKKIYDACFKN